MGLGLHNLFVHEEKLQTARPVTGSLEAASHSQHGNYIFYTYVHMYL